MNSREKDKKTLSSVTNTLQILRLFTSRQRELSFTGIRNQLNLPKGSAHRYISFLVEEGFLTKNPKTNHYRLGLSILSLGGAIFSHHELYEEALPIVDALSNSLNESVHICLMENQRIVYLFRIESRHPDRLVTQIGRTNPIHCTGEGLCILAFQSENYIKKVLQKELYAYTPYTVTDPDELWTLLSEIQEKDYCLLQSSYYENYTSIATPIRNHEAEVVASLSVIGHANRITDENTDDIIEKMKVAANQISQHMGYIEIE